MKRGLELLAMGAVVDPLPRHRQPLPGRDDGGMADHRHQIAMAPSLDPQDAKAVVGVMEGDALDKTDQDFLERRFRLWAGLAVAAHDVPSRVSGLCCSHRPCPFREVRGGSHGIP